MHVVSFRPFARCQDVAYKLIRMPKCLCASVNGFHFVILKPNDPVFKSHEAAKVAGSATV